MSDEEGNLFIGLLFAIVLIGWCCIAFAAIASGVGNPIEYASERMVFIGIGEIQKR